MQVSKVLDMKSKNMLKSDKFNTYTIQYDLEKATVDENNVMLAGTPYPVIVVEETANYVKNGDFSAPVTSEKYGDFYLDAYEKSGGVDVPITSSVENSTFKGKQCLETIVEGSEDGIGVYGSVHIKFDKDLTPESWDNGVVNLYCNVSADRRTDISSPSLVIDTGTNYVITSTKPLTSDVTINEWKPIKVSFNKANRNSNCIKLNFHASKNTPLKVYLSDVVVKVEKYSREDEVNDTVVGLTFEDIDFNQEITSGAILIKGSVAEGALPTHVPDTIKTVLKNINFL